MTLKQVTWQDTFAAIQSVTIVKASIADLVADALKADALARTTNTGRYGAPSAKSRHWHTPFLPRIS